MSKRRARNPVKFEDDQLIMLRALIKKTGHNKKLVGFQIISAAPHVRLHIFDGEETFQSVDALMDAIREGYVVMVSPDEETVPVIKFMAAEDIAR
jgi:hypothetical protein